MNNWIDGIPYEIAFWKGVYSNKKSINRLFRWSKYNDEISLANFDVKQFLSQQENPVIVDVGCGISYWNGNKLDGKPLNVCYLDPLAPFFNEIIDKKKLDLPKITFGFIEHLSVFLPEKVSLIIVQNALDHCNDPVKGILECVESLKIGAVLYLRHKPNEAEAENYRGFHQYNVSLENNEMVIWNKKVKINVNSTLMNFANVETSIYDGEIIAVVTKKQDLPKEFFDFKKDISDLYCQYIAVIQNFNQISYSFRYHWNFFKYRVIQLFIQRFSYKTKMKMKKIIRTLTSIIKK